MSEPVRDQAETRQRIIAVMPVLRREGVVSVAIFGSSTRNEMVAESDVDVLVEFAGPARFRPFMRVREALREALGRPVDLVTRAGLKPRLAKRIERDLIRVA